MKRLLAVLVFILGSTSLDAATRWCQSRSGVNGDGSVGRSGAWQCCATNYNSGTCDTTSLPIAGDWCRIVTGNQMVLDGNLTCGTLELQTAAILTSDGRSAHTITLNPGGVSGATWAAYISGQVSLGRYDTVLVDAASGGTTNAEIELRSGGVLSARGARLGEGIISSVSGETCPVGTYYTTEVPAHGPPGSDFQADDCTNITVHVEGLTFETGQLDGQVLAFRWPAGHRETWYDIVSSTAPDTLVLDYNSRGQMQPYGILPPAQGNATAGAADTTMDWKASNLTGVWDDNLVGGWFYFNADCPSPTTPNMAEESGPLSGVGPASSTLSHFGLPCGDARRIVAITDGGAGDDTVTLESAYAHAATNQAATIVGVAGQVVTTPEYIERVAPGDPFVVFDPVTFNIPTANKSGVQTYPATTANQDKNWGGFDMYDGSRLTLEYAEVYFAARGDSVLANNTSPIDMQHTTSGNPAGTPTPGLTLDTVDIGFFSGYAAIEFRNMPNTTMRHLYIHDGLQTNLSKPSESPHGILFGANQGANLSVLDTRVIRVGDDAYAGTGGPGDYGTLLLRRVIAAYISQVTPDASGSCFDIAHINTTPSPDERTGGTTFWLDQFLCTNVEDGGLTAVNTSADVSAESGSWGTFLVTNGIFQNLAYHAETSHDISNKRYVDADLVNPINVNVVVWNMCTPAVASVACVGLVGNAYSSLVNEVKYGVRFGPVVKGVVATVPVTSSSAVSFATNFVTDSDLPTGVTTETFQDVALFMAGQTTPIGIQAGATQSSPTVNSTYGVTIDHATLVNLPAVGGQLTNSSGIGVYGGSQVTVTNSLFWQQLYAIDLRGALTPGTPANHVNFPGTLYNVFLGGNYTNYECYGSSSCGATLDASNSRDASTTTLAYDSLAPFRPMIARATTPWTLSGATTPVGARAAGPSNWPLLMKINPAVGAIRDVGVYYPEYASDSDGDGIYDIHDNCPLVANPAQGACP